MTALNHDQAQVEIGRAVIQTLVQLREIKKQLDVMSQMTNDMYEFYLGRKEARKNGTASTTTTTTSDPSGPGAGNTGTKRPAKPADGKG